MYYIIYQTAFIGDIILSTSMIETIIHADLKARIVFITSPAGASFLKNDKRINYLITYDKRKNDKGIHGLIKKRNEILKIKRDGASIFISPHRFIRASLFGYLSNSYIRAGFKGSSLSFLYNKLEEYRFDIHEIERNFGLLKKVFGNKLSGAIPLKPVILPSENDHKKVKKIILNHFNKKDKIISIAPGSVWHTKRWPVEYYKILINDLIRYGFKIILIGGNDDINLCKSLEAQNVLNLAGEFSILESAAAISMSMMLITNDSAPVHLASAVNIPTLAIFGPTIKNLGFGPLADKSIVVENNTIECRPCGRHGGKKCKEKHFNCMKSINPEMVLDTTLKILNIITS